MKKGLTLLNFDKEAVDSCGKFTFIFKDGTMSIYIAKNIGESTDFSGFIVIATKDGTDIQSFISKDSIKEIILEEASEEEMRDDNS